MNHRAVSLLAAVMLIGCSSPAVRIDRLAETFAFERTIVQGTDFSHLVYRKRSVSSGSLWHVYIEHDGLPWKNRYRISEDPTPRHPLALRLMAQDPVSSLYLGRPCYFGFSNSPGCDAAVWTTARYSERVVTSMAKALQAALPPGPVQLVLIGHSGGGTLAWLLASRLAQVRAVLTLAANLDVAAWTAYHDYSPLGRSLDPALLPGPGPRVRQVHYTGGKDQRVPAHLLGDFAARHPDATFIEYPDFDHTCCWESVWPDILTAIPINSDS